MIIHGLIIGALIAVVMCGAVALVLASWPPAKPHAPPPTPAARVKEPKAQERRARPEGFLQTKGVKRKAQREAEMASLISGLPEAKVLKVLDGDTVIVERAFRKVKVRLDSIDCPEDGQAWGDSATHGLVKLIGGKTVNLEVHGLDTYGRTLATIYVKQERKWQNVNERMITLGHAWVMRMFYDHLPPDRQSKLERLEAWAKSKKVGLWAAENPTAPWLWRNPHLSGDSRALGN